jgi:hypothetical protein
MTHRTIRGPHCVGRQGGNQGHGEGQIQKFAHGKTGSGRVQGSWVITQSEMLNTTNQSLMTVPSTLDEILFADDLVFRPDLSRGCGIFHGVN